MPQRFLQGLTRCDAGSGPAVLGLAVSGGGDSMALLHLAVAAGLPCRAVTVDHGLRAESAAEAAGVARACAALAVPHDTLRWQGWDGRGNLQDQARRARYALIAEWALAHGIAAVALGHNRDDVAETLLLRLARGAGVDGLAAMAARRRHQGVNWLRPLLEIGRGELRDWLAGRGVVWVDDPSNDNARFDRVRLRQAAGTLAALGLTTERLAEVAGHLAQVRAALEVQTRDAARKYARIEAGDVVIDPAALHDLPEEIARRLLASALIRVSSAEYGPRGPALAAALAKLRAGRPATLLGCRMLLRPEGLRVLREWQAVRDHVTTADALWDGRWRVYGPEINGLELRALGAAGLARCPDWRATGVPRASLLASVSAWRGAELLAAPLAGFGLGWRAEIAPAPDGDFLCALSH
nr:tRNA lysidine(34) synthetase TilS [Rhodobacter sp. SW2]